MVSVGPDFQVNTGAQYMDEEDRSSASGAAVIGRDNIEGDNQELLFSQQGTLPSTFKPLKTIPAFSIHLLISTVISFVGIVLAAVWPAEERCKAYFIMLYLRAGFWVITFLFDHIIKKHHDDLRMNGYHEFHRATAMQKGVPFIIVSMWNSMLLAVQALIHHFYGDKFWEHCVDGWLSPITYVTAFNVAETAVLALTHGFYMAKVRRFNKSAQLPDALRGSNNALGSLGLMQSNSNTAELLEKQADLIAYLKDHNQKLNQKLHHMMLNARTVHNDPYIS